MAGRTRSEFEAMGGWVPDEHGVDDVLAELEYPEFGPAAQQVGLDGQMRDTYLWKYLVNCYPRYKRHAQAIGSCVAWGGEIAQTVLCCKEWARKGVKPKAQVSTEANYGLCRVEILGKTTAGYSDGAFGGSMAKAARDYGCVLRKDHSKTTGIAEHNLVHYSGKKEKEWGNYGCGGKHDKGLLDQIAKERPVKHISRVRTFDDVAKSVCLLQSPVTIASSYGTTMKRDKYGQCYWNGSWMHQMAILAVRFGAHPAAWIVQSWGPQTCTGASGDQYCEDLPDRGTPHNILGFGWWAPAEDIDKICSSGDCWSYVDMQGLAIDRLRAPRDWKDRKQTWRQTID